MAIDILGFDRTARNRRVRQRSGDTACEVGAASLDSARETAVGDIRETGIAHDARERLLSTMPEHEQPVIAMRLTSSAPNAQPTMPPPLAADNGSSHVLLY